MVQTDTVSKEDRHSLKLALKKCAGEGWYEVREEFMPSYWRTVGFIRQTSLSERANDFEGVFHLDMNMENP
jgi:hypothetical protein